jgi:hypothetical protein
MGGDLYSKAREFLADFISTYRTEIERLRLLDSLGRELQQLEEEIKNRRDSPGSELWRLEEEKRDRDNKFSSAASRIKTVQELWIDRINKLDDKAGRVSRALVSWVDEIMIGEDQSKWWRSHPLEAKIPKFGTTTDSSWRFWEEAGLCQDKKTGTWEIYGGSLARARAKDQSLGTSISEMEELKIFYLCVVLGFRGSLWDPKDRLQQWVEEAAQVLAPPDRGPYSKPSGEPAKRLAVKTKRDRSPRPDLQGHRRLKRMIYLGSIPPAVLLSIVLLWYVATLLNY